MTFPLTINSAFSLEWSKSVNDDAELLLAIKEGLELSPIGEVLIRSSEPIPTRLLSLLDTSMKRPNLVCSQEWELRDLSQRNAVSLGLLTLASYHSETQ